MIRVLALVFAFLLSISGCFADGFPTSSTGLIKSAQIDPSAGITGSQLAANTVTASQIANNTVTLTQLDPGVLQMSTTSLSSSDILNLHTTPKTLVAAQGSGKVIIFDHALCYFHYNGIQYTSGAACQVNYNGTGPIQVSAGSGLTQILAGSDQIFEMAATFSPGGTVANMANVALALTASTNFATGNGTMTVYCWYRVITP